MKKALKSFLTLTLTFLAITLSLSLRKEGRAATILYSTTSFEASEGFTASTTYNQTKVEGEEGKTWTFFYGTPTTSKKINGDQSAALRLYTAKKYGYLMMNYDITGITRVEYQAKADTTNSAKILLDTYYSIDQGKSWTIIDEQKELTTTAKTYTFDVPEKDKEEDIRIKFEISDKSTNPSSSSAQLTIDDVSIYVYRNMTTLDVPTATISGSVVSVNPNGNTDKYVVGLFESEESLVPLKTFTQDIDKTQRISISAQGTYIVRVKAIDSTGNHIDSEYSEPIGTLNVTTVNDLTVSEALEAEADTTKPYTYYYITGRVGEILDTKKATFTLIDPYDITKTITVFDMKNLEGASYSMAGLGIEMGDNVTIKAAIIKTQSGIRLEGQLVESEVNSLGRFSAYGLEARVRFTFDKVSYVKGGRFEKISDANEIEDGSLIGIGQSSYLAFMSPDIQGSSSTKYMSSIEGNYTGDGFILRSDDLTGMFYTVEIIDGSYYLKNGENYLGIYKEDSKTMMVLDQKATEGATYSWIIKNHEGTIRIESSDESAGRLQYNSSNPRFTCYTSNQKPLDIYIYREMEEPVYEGLKATVMFRIKASTEVYGNIRKEFKDIVYSFSDESYTLEQSYTGEGFFLYATIENVTDMKERIGGSFKVVADGEIYNTSQMEVTIGELADLYLRKLSGDDSVVRNKELLYYIVLNN